MLFLALFKAYSSREFVLHSFGGAQCILCAAKPLRVQGNDFSCAQTDSIVELKADRTVVLRRAWNRLGGPKQTIMKQVDLVWAQRNIMPVYSEGVGNGSAKYTLFASKIMINRTRSMSTHLKMGLDIQTGAH